MKYLYMSQQIEDLPDGEPGCGFFRVFDNPEDFFKFFPNDQPLMLEVDDED